MLKDYFQYLMLPTHWSLVISYLYLCSGFPGGSDAKASLYNVGDLCSIPGLGRFPGKGNGNPLQYSCLENSMDRGAWQATVHGVAKDWRWLSDWACTHIDTQQSCVLSKVAGGFSEAFSCKPCRGHSAWPTVTISKGYFFATINEI